MKPKAPYLIFHQNLSGYDYFKNGKFVPRYILYWSGYNSEMIKTGKTDIKIRPK